MLVELGNLVMHIPWLRALLTKLGLVSDELHDMFCNYGCEVAELAW